MRRTTTTRPRSYGSWLRAPTPTGTRTRCVPAPAPAPPRCRPPPRPSRALANCAALTTRTTPPPHVAGWRHRLHVLYRQRTHGGRAGAAGRGGRPQRQGRSTPAPRCPAPVAARRRSLTRRVRRTAAPSCRAARPPSTGPASGTTILRSWRCWRRRSRGAAWAGWRRAAALPLLAPPRLLRLAAVPMGAAGQEPASGHGMQATKSSWTSKSKSSWTASESKSSWTSSSGMRQKRTTATQPTSSSFWLRAQTPMVFAWCVPAPVLPCCRPPAILPTVRHSRLPLRRCRTLQV
jgi:hypothetical protein